jgi:hypothetical protein
VLSLHKANDVLAVALFDAGFDIFPEGRDPFSADLSQGFQRWPDLLEHPPDNRRGNETDPE